MEELNYLFYEYQNNPKLSVLKKLIPLYYKNNISLNRIYLGKSLLHVKASFDCIEYILNRGADPNVRDIYGITPIHLQEEYDVIKLLVRRGASANPLCSNGLNPLFWKKDPKATNYLLELENDIYLCPTINPSEHSTYSPYFKLLVDAGYDPYDKSNTCIASSQIFFQNNPLTLFNLISKTLNSRDLQNNFDILFETILFKPCLKPQTLILFNKNLFGGFIDHQNVIGNTALHVQYNLEITSMLLTNGADTTIKNDDGETAYDYHLKRNNLCNANLIQKFSSAKIIQNNWKSFWFKKCYVPPKFYKKKLEFLDELIFLSPSDCHTFPGGIEYQKALEDFKQSFQSLVDLSSSGSGSTSADSPSSLACF